MTTKEKWDLIWQAAPYVLALLGYLIGKARNLMNLPAPVASLLKRADVQAMMREGVKAAEKMSGKTDDDKRQYVRDWAKNQLYDLIGHWLPDSTVNLLIERAIVLMKRR